MYSNTHGKHDHQYSSNIKSAAVFIGTFFFFFSRISFSLLCEGIAKCFEIIWEHKESPLTIHNYNLVHGFCIYTVQCIGHWLINSRHFYQVGDKKWCMNDFELFAFEILVQSGSGRVSSMNVHFSEPYMICEKHKIKMWKHDF